MNVYIYYNKDYNTTIKIYNNNYYGMTILHVMDQMPLKCIIFSLASSSDTFPSAEIRRNRYLIRYAAGGGV